MTLTAVLEDGRLLNPSAEISAGADPGEVITIMRRFSRLQSLFCPHCLRVEGVRLNVKFRSGGESRRHHFYHVGVEGEDSKLECRNYSKVSDRHINTQAFLKEDFERHPLVERVETEILVTAEDGRKRRPDVLVFFKDGTKAALEVQCSPIAVEGDRGIMQRTQDLRDAGCDFVAWYLSGRAYASENRRFLHQNGIQFFRVDFDEENHPIITAGTLAKEVKKGKGGSDKCRSSALVEQAINAAKQKARLDAERAALRAKEEAQRIERMAIESAQREKDLQEWERLQSVREAEERERDRQSRIPAGAELVRVKTKQGWLGYIAEIPWGQAGVCVDIQWVKAPARDDGTYPDIPKYAVRFPESLVERL